MTKHVLQTLTLQNSQNFPQLLGVSRRRVSRHNYCAHMAGSLEEEITIRLLLKRKK